MIELKCEDGGVTCQVAGTLSTLLTDVRYISASLAKGVLDCARNDMDRIMIMAALSASFANAVPTAIEMMIDEMNRSESEDSDEEESGDSRTQISIDLRALRELLNQSRGETEDDEDESDD